VSFSLAEWQHDERLSSYCHHYVNLLHHNFCAKPLPEIPGTCGAPLRCCTAGVLHSRCCTVQHFHLWKACLVTTGTVCLVTVHNHCLTMLSSAAYLSSVRQLVPVLWWTVNVIWFVVLYVHCCAILFTGILYLSVRYPPCDWTISQPSTLILRTVLLTEMICGTHQMIVWTSHCVTSLVMYNNFRLYFFQDPVKFLYSNLNGDMLVYTTPAPSICYLTTVLASVWYSRLKCQEVKCFFSVLC